VLKEVFGSEQVSAAVARGEIAREVGVHAAIAQSDRAHYTHMEYQVNKPATPAT
jgi:hypothetical protein